MLNSLSDPSVLPTPIHHRDTLTSATIAMWVCGHNIKSQCPSSVHKSSLCSILLLKTFFWRFICEDAWVSGLSALTVICAQAPGRAWLFVTPLHCSTQRSCGLHSLGICSDSCPLSQWCHPTISSSAASFSFCPQPFPTSVFSTELALSISWPKYWSFSFSISPHNENSGLISFRIH